MKTRFRILAGCGAAALLGALIAVPAVSQRSGSGPVARYTIDAGTVSGMGAMCRPRRVRSAGDAPKHSDKRIAGDTGHEPGTDAHRPASALLGVR
jgi:hypothetical protein